MVNLTGGGLSGGYLKYLQQMVPLLQADPRVRCLHVMMPPGVHLPEDRGLETFTWPQSDAPLGYPRLRAQLRQVSPDVIFIPTGRWVNGDPIPTVIMIRNMEPLVTPFRGNSLRESIRNFVRAYAAQLACRRANRVIAVSQHVRDFLVERWQVNANKVALVYHGVEDPASRAETVIPKPLESYDINRFIFIAGSIRPARGLEDVIQAMAILVARDPTLALLVGGNTDPGTEFYRRRLDRLAQALGVGTRIIWAGQLKPLEMSWCYYHCEAFVTTSRAEACPNTALEAMSHGCQLVSTSQAPMQEFFKEAALYYRPKDSVDLAAQIQRALDASPEERRTRQQCAQARSLNFRWSDSAQKTIDHLELAAGVAC